MVSSPSAAVVRYVALIVLCVQNASNTLLIRYSRAILGERWSTLSTVIVGEAVKLTCVLFMIISTQTHTQQPSQPSQQLTPKQDKTKRRLHSREGQEMEVEQEDDMELEPLTGTNPIPRHAPTHTRSGSDSNLSISSPTPSSHPLTLSDRMSLAWSTIWHVFRSTPRLCVPGGIYLIQNILQQQALQRLPAATYSLLAQLKLLTTAFFAVTLLGRRLSPTQIRALVLLFVGVVLVLQAPPPKPIPTPTPSTDHMQVIEAGTNDTLITSTLQVAPIVTSPLPTSQWFLGLFYALAVATLSGFGGCYLELLLKAPRPSAHGLLPPLSLWEINSGLCLWGLIFGFGSLLVLPDERNFFIETGFFHDYSIITIIIIALGAGGGILVAIVVKYADNIIKGFAVTLSVVLTSLLSWRLFGDVEPDASFICGAVVVLVAVANYNDPAAAPIPIAPTATPTPAPIPDDKTTPPNNVTITVAQATREETNK